MENLNGFNNGRDLSDGVGGQSEEKDKRIEELRNGLMLDLQERGVSLNHFCRYNIGKTIIEAIEYGESLARERAAKAKYCSIHLLKEGDNACVRCGKHRDEF